MSRSARRRRTFARASLVLLCALCLLAPTSAQQAGKPRALLLTHSAGYEHGVVKRPRPDAPSHAERAFLAATHARLDVVATQDASVLADGGLADFDVLVFCTTGELPIDADARQALVDWVADGGAFVGVHCATDTFYEFAPYQRMLGGAFDGHPWHREVDLRVEDRLHPATLALPERWTLTDEIYQFRDFERHPTEVLISLEDGKADLSLGKRDDGDYAVSWCKPYGRGRVFYTSLGHRPEVWDAPLFQAHLLGGLAWTLRGPDRPTPPPPGATILFDGGAAASLNGWSTRDGGPARWTSDGAELAVLPGSGDQLSRQTFGDQLLHVEFLVPELADDVSGQARGNSGVYVLGRYEVQVLDSFGLSSGDGDCAAIYGVAPPSRNACRKPGRWQSYDIRLRAPRFDAAGAKTEDARMSVWHNGVQVHDDVVVPGPTPAAAFGDEQPTGPLMLQDHGNLVRYRNVWVLLTSD